MKANVCDSTAKSIWILSASTSFVWGDGMAWSWVKAEAAIAAASSVEYHLISYKPIYACT